MPPLVIAGIVLGACLAIIPLSNLILGKGNVVAADAEQVIQQEAPEIMNEVEKSEAPVANPASSS